MALAIAMWDHSVFTRRSGSEAEFADWDRALDELAERGYDCIRIDAWPHLVDAEDPHFVLKPQRPRWMWGNHSPVTIDPRADVAILLRKARERHIRVGLSSWFQPDTEGARRLIRRPNDYARAWTKTLELLEDQLGNVAWVDLCNEFPLGLWAPSAWRHITRTRWPNLLPLLRLGRAARARMEEYFTAIDPLRARWPDLRYTFSFQGLIGGQVFRSLDLTRFDLLDAHIWLSNDPLFLLASGQAAQVLELPGSRPLHQWLGPRVYNGSPTRWRRRLAKRMDLWWECAHRYGVPLVNTEGWAVTMYEDTPRGSGSEWSWVKNACAAGVELAIERGFAGICTSNFCQPTFPGMWNDVGWHRAMTHAIRKSPDTLEVDVKLRQVP